MSRLINPAFFHDFLVSLKPSPDRIFVARAKSAEKWREFGNDSTLWLRASCWRSGADPSWVQDRAEVLTWLMIFSIAAALTGPA